MYGLKGALSALDLILRVADDTKRKAMFASFAREHLEDVTSRDVAGDFVVVAQICESAMTVGGLTTYALMLNSGMEEEAASWLKWMTAQKPVTGAYSPAFFRTNFLAGDVALLSLRSLSWVAAAAQVLYSIAVLLDENASDSDKLAAVWGLGFSGAGLAGAGFTGMGIEALAGVSGYLTVGLLVLGAATAAVRHVVREREQSEATHTTGAAFTQLEAAAATVVADINRLQEILAREQPISQRAELASIVVDARPGAGSGRPAHRVAGAPTEQEYTALERASGQQAAVLRRTLVRVLSQSASSPASSGWFDAVRRQLAEASTPIEVRDAALAFLATVRDLFRHFERTVARRLRASDRKYMQDLDEFSPGLLRGLHDELKAKAAEGSAGAAELDRAQYGRD